MIIVGSVNSNKTSLLVNAYLKLINEGAKPEEILFLTLNSYKKNKVLNEIKAFLPGISPNVQTFSGLCYNSVLSNWDILQKSIPYGENKPEPILCGLEVSQNLLLQAVKEVDFKDYNSKINLVHQLLRRHSLIVCNNLTEEEVKEKSLILNEKFAAPAQKALEIFKMKSLETRTFDYIRQQSLFKYLYEKTNALTNLKHILIDDYDEQTPACTDFFKHLKPSLKSYTIAIDTKGSTRCGYLCADLNCTEILKEEKNVIQAKETKFSPKIQKFNFSKRLEALKNTLSMAANLIDAGVSPEEICIISPMLDNQLKFMLENGFSEKNINVQFISGSEKLVDNILIKSILDLLKLINKPETGTEALNSIFSILLKIPVAHACFVIQQFKKTGGFIKYDFLDDTLNEKYDKFLSLAAKTLPENTLSEQLQKIYTDFIAGAEFSPKDISDFNFLEKQIKQLEVVVNNKTQILRQLENSIIAENDINTFHLERNSIITGTPQKITDYEIKSKYQFWLDTTNDEWVKQDTGTIYNAAVFARSWKKPAYTYEDGINFAKEKAKRLLRKLKKLCETNIYAISSSYNALGQENYGGISEFLGETAQKTVIKPISVFIPRDDQKAILDYKKGKMAVTAVPGAGKTTVLQALISKLLTENVPAENIFVLTYMESAAKTIKSRLTESYPDLNTYPNISTIHGLALRIIKENGNNSYINLDENFEICDELQRQKLIRETIGELNLKYDEYEKFEKGISTAKFTQIENTPKTKECKEFLKFYKLYEKKLSENNLIDYDDMLIFAIKILTKNPQILEHYQSICKVIIEDEAQDSSQIQQKLIMLLAGKYNNIIRCGDLNQAITATFTNADTKGFQNFLKGSSVIKMNRSQRCCKEIYELANKLIDNSKLSPETKNAFYDIKMKEVENKNPKSTNPIIAKIFDTEQEEKNAIIKRIKEILKANPAASVAILLRNNYQVNDYGFLLRENGIATISRTDCLEQTPVFNIILSILRFVNEPWNNNLAQEVYKNIFNIKEENLYLSNLEVPFITTDTGVLDDENLIALHWELNYWLSLSAEPFEALALKIGQYYCKNEIEYSNLFIIAEIVRRITSIAQNRSDIINKLEQTAKKPTIAGLKLFSEDGNTVSTMLGGKVQIMTMHKAKGDEFDYVFIPAFTENSLGTTIKSVRTGNFVSFYEEIKMLAPDYKPKNLPEMKKEILEENLRLLYVAITRAKLQICFTSAKKYKQFGKLKPAEPSSHFKQLLSNYIK